MSQCNHVERWKCDMASHSGGGSCDACDSEWQCPECQDHDRMARDQAREATLAALRAERDAALAEVAAQKERLDQYEAECLRRIEQVAYQTVRATAAQAEVARMRPVVEAAEAWEELTLPEREVDCRIAEAVLAAESGAPCQHAADMAALRAEVEYQKAERLAAQERSTAEAGRLLRVLDAAERWQSSRGYSGGARYYRDKHKENCDGLVGALRDYREQEK